MIWRDSRGRFVRVPKTAIKAVVVSVYPTRDVVKNWKPDSLRDRAIEAVRYAIGGKAGKVTKDNAGETAFTSPVSFDHLADVMEYGSSSISDIDLEGAALWLGVRLQNGQVIPITRAYTTTDEVIRQSANDLRRHLSKYLPEDAEDDEPEEPEEDLPPEPIRYNVRDAKGRFVKRG